MGRRLDGAGEAGATAANWPDASDGGAGACANISCAVESPHTHRYNEEGGEHSAFQAEYRQNSICLLRACCSLLSGQTEVTFAPARTTERTLLPRPLDLGSGNWENWFYCFAVNTNGKPLKRIRIRESFGETVNISQRC